MIATIIADSTHVGDGNQVDALTAGRELRGLVQAGLVEQQARSAWWTYYTLIVPRELPGQSPAVS